jgi:hypothetical protein
MDCTAPDDMKKGRKKAIPASADSDKEVRDAASLWNLLSQKGRLYPKTHDKKFVDDLRVALHVPEDEEIIDFLTRMRPDTTTFMLAVLNAFEPFGRMLSAIYAMFVRHGLKESDDKVLVEFDFGEAAGKLQFDANHFRTLLRALSQIRVSLDAHQFTGKDLVEICYEIGGALADANNQPPAPHRALRILGISPEGEPIGLTSIPRSESLRRWLEPEDDRKPGYLWPYATSPPLPDLSALDPVDQALKPLIMALGDLCSIAREYPSYEAFEKAAGTAEDPGLEMRAAVTSWSRGAARRHIGDRLAISILEILWHCSSLAPRDLRSRQDLAQRIVEIIKGRSTLAHTQTPIEALEEFLDLPLWNYREKIYSVWLITIVESAFSDGEFVMMGDNGKLVFVFGKTLVARIRTWGAELDLISEMRTPAGNIKLLGRTYGVQPDYIVNYRDGSPMGRVVYVLEAKQYAKADLKEFREALYDYAAVHKESLVSLVNYGPMSKSIDTAVAAIAAEREVEGLAERCTAFGNVEPMFPDNIRKVREHIRQAIRELAAADMTPPTLIVDVSYSMSLLLPETMNSALPELWGALAKSRMPMIFVADGFERVYPGSPSADVVQLTRSHLQSTALRLGEFEASRRKGAVLLTDKDGFKECAEAHRELAAFIVLYAHDQAKIHVNPDYLAKLQCKLPDLLKSVPPEDLVVLDA